MEVPANVNVRFDFHLYIHFPDPIRLLELGPARRAILKIGDSHMPSSINVDTTDETATLAFVDDRGNETPSPSGASVTFSSDDESVATVAADPSNPLVGSITPVAPGDCNISVDVQGATEPDGVTPLPNPDPVSLHVDPGAPVGERLSVGPN